MFRAFAPARVRFRTVPTQVVTVLAALSLMAVSGQPAGATGRALFDGLSSAGAAVIQLQGLLPGIVLLSDYSQDTDPDHLLGLTGQYVAKATFHDAGLSFDPYEVTGAIEVFANERDLRNRRLTLQRVVPLEPNVAVGVVLVRLFTPTTTDQFTAYDTAVRTIVLT